LDNMKEQIVLDLMIENRTHTTNHDDRLTLALWTSIKRKADQHGNYQTGIGLHPDAKRLPGVIKQHDEGQVKISHYWNGKAVPEAVNISKEMYDKMDYQEQLAWQSISPHEKVLADNIKLVILTSSVELRICRLFDNIANKRYELALDSMERLLNDGFFKYEPRNDEPTRKNKRDAIRMRIKRAFQMLTYEHNVLLNEQYGQIVYDLLKPKAVQVVKGGNGETLYLNAKSGQRQVKVYSPTMREGRGTKELYKLEITFKSQFFNEHNIKIDDMLTQPEIQCMLFEQMVDVIARSFNGVDEGGLKVLAELYSIDTRDRDKVRKEIARAMLGRTLTDEVADLKRKVQQNTRDIEQNTRDIEQLKRITGLGSK
jgi:hypothetical protein